MRNNSFPLDISNNQLKVNPRLGSSNLANFLRGIYGQK